jgi:5'-nucleotidase/UDP-sugar diphosphatase
VGKNRDGQPLTSKVEALDDPRADTPEILAPTGTMDRTGVDTARRNGAVREINEWQAIMDHLRNLPTKSPGVMPIIPVDERAAEIRAIKVADERTVQP